MNWDDLETVKKRGSCCIKEKYLVGETERIRWIVDSEIPIFNQDRDYINKLIYIGE